MHAAFAANAWHLGPMRAFDWRISAFLLGLCAFTGACASNVLHVGLDAGAHPDAANDGAAESADADLAVDLDGHATAAARDAAVDGDAAEAGGAPDAGTDAGCPPFEMPQDCVIPADSALPSELRCTGLYKDFGRRELSCDVEAYRPAYQLWSDGAEKQRYVALPRNGKIDASDPNEPVYPVGTKFWKEFRAADGSGKLLETRLLQKLTAGWVYTSYVWSADETTAMQTNDGAKNVRGTGHDVPTRMQCNECHAGRKDKILGWDAFLLGAGAEGVGVEELSRRGAFFGGKVLMPQAIPGDDVERAALGYLHVNCGVSCHNENNKASDTGLFLRLLVGATPSAQAVPAVTTSANRVPGPNAKYEGLVLPSAGFYDVRPGDLARSFLLARMQVRGPNAQMPPLGSNVVDATGVATITAWIAHMTEARGYPQAQP